MGKHHVIQGDESLQGLSRLRAELGAKSLHMANSLREAESSRNPDARKYVEYVDRRRREARASWEPTR